MVSAGPPALVVPTGIGFDVQCLTPLLVDIEFVGRVVIAEVVCPRSFGVKALIFHFSYSRPAFAQGQRGVGEYVGEVGECGMLLTMSVTIVHLGHHIACEPLLCGAVLCQHVCAASQETQRAEEKSEFMHFDIMFYECKVTTSSEIIALRRYT